MDVHPGLGEATPDDVAEAHRRDLEMQEEYGVRWLAYWFNDPAGNAVSESRNPGHLTWEMIELAGSDTFDREKWVVTVFIIPNTEVDQTFLGSGKKIDSRVSV